MSKTVTCQHELFHNSSDVITHVHQIPGYRQQHLGKTGIFFTAISGAAATLHGQQGVFCIETVRGHLCTAGLHARHPYISLSLTQKYTFVLGTQTYRPWHHALFSDESCFHLRNAGSNLCEWHQHGETRRKRLISQRQTPNSKDKTKHRTEEQNKPHSQRRIMIRMIQWQLFRYTTGMVEALSFGSIIHSHLALPWWHNHDKKWYKILIDIKSVLRG